MSLRASAVVLLVGLLCAAACGDGGEVEAPSPAPIDLSSVEVSPAPVSLRRLTIPQYHNVVRDLLGESVVLPTALEPDTRTGGLVSIGAALSTISARGIEQYEQASYDLAEQAMADPEIRASIVPCAPSGVEDAACAGSAVRSFGRRVWRRPLADEEVEGLVSIALEAARVRGDFFKGFEFAIAALLQSPHFLFRVEIGEQDGQGRRFTDYEMAARLSFLLWDTGPDQALLDAAERGELTDDAGLAAQVERLLASPRARAGVRSFFSDLFNLRALDALSKDPTIFEHISPEVGPAAREETLLGLEWLIFEEDGDYRDVMTTRRTFLNRKLASIYSVPAPAREGFAEAELPEESERVGLLGQVSFLALNAHPVSSSVTLRGLFVRETLLCQDVPLPPSNVDTSIPEPSGETPTLRDRVAEHLENEACVGCHLRTDPIGLGLENFDGLGRFRLRDNEVLIDASGDLDGVAFEGPRGLAEALREHERLGPCLVRNLVRYANGHQEVPGEADMIDALSKAFEGRGHRVKALLFDLATSPGFRRAGEVQ